MLPSNKFKVQSSKFFKIFHFALSLLIFHFALLTSTPTVHAQQYQPPIQTNPYLQPNTNPDVPQDLGTFTQSVMLNLMTAMICQLSGINVLNQSQSCLGVDPETGNIGFIPTSSNQAQIGGAIGVAGNLIAATFTYPPASTGDYIAYMGSKFGAVQPAYAQTAGIGFRGITPIVKIWEVFRNITYLLFVLVFVIIGFAIMLRVKIDPRTVMTIQNSIPKVIIALILVTLSFAISGLFIDIMYVSIFLIARFFSENGFIGTTTVADNINNNPIGLVNNLYDPGIAGGIINVAKNAAHGLQDTVSKLFAPSVGADLLLPFRNIIPGVSTCQGILDFGCWFGQGLVGGVVNGFAQILGGFLSWIVAVLAFLIVLVAILWSLFRLWFQLLMAYVWILVDIVFAPFWILAGVLPGSPVSFSAWLRDIIAHLSAFPTTIFFFLLAKLFMDAFVASGQSGAAFVPPFIGTPTAGALGAIIGLGFILLTPQVVTMVKDALKAPKFPYGVAIGQALGTGPGVAGAGFSAVTSPYGTLAPFMRMTLGKDQYGSTLGAFLGVVRKGKDVVKETERGTGAAGAPPPQQSQ